MSAHTPGPWRVDAITNSLGTIETADGVSIGQAFQVRPHRDDLHSIERKANARLMAAAPDLLAALEEAIEYIPARDRSVLIAKARAAIAKATGESA